MGSPWRTTRWQFEWIVTIEGGLESLYRDDPDVFVAGDLLWYAVEGEPKVRTAPDILVAFGRPKGRRGSYKQWEEGGIAPQVVFEILLSGQPLQRNAPEVSILPEVGVEEYYIYNPDDGSLEGWPQGGERLKVIPKMDGFVSPRLGIRFEPGGTNNLVIIRPDGTRFLTYVELMRAFRGRTPTRRGAGPDRPGRTPARRRAGARSPPDTPPACASWASSPIEPLHSEAAMRRILPPFLAIFCLALSSSLSPPAAKAHEGQALRRRSSDLPRRCRRGRHRAAEIPGPGQRRLPASPGHAGQRPAPRQVPGPRRWIDPAGDRRRR